MSRSRRRDKRMRENANANAEFYVPNLNVQSLLRQRPFGELQLVGTIEIHNEP